MFFYGDCNNGIPMLDYADTNTITAVKIIQSNTEIFD